MGMPVRHELGRHYGKRVGLPEIFQGELSWLSAALTSNHINLLQAVMRHLRPFPIITTECMKWVNGVYFVHGSGGWRASDERFVLCHYMVESSKGTNKCTKM